jgi:hypothetical protein
MSLEADLFAALKSLVGNRCVPNTFPQPPAVPTWPAIRYTMVSRVPVVDICGDGDDATAEPRVQLDIVAETYPAAEALRVQVRAAMRSFSPPAICENAGMALFDADTKTHRFIMEYVFQGSS